MAIGEFAKVVSIALFQYLIMNDETLNTNRNIRIIISIGNPGKKYYSTRHNAGHLVREKYFQKNFPNIPNIEFAANVKSLASDKFMNNSGDFVAQQLAFYKCKPEELLVLHDDLDIPLGEYKLQFAKGPKVHNGINDIESKIRTKNFWRMRIGIDGRLPESRDYIQGRDYVLDNFTKEELNKLLSIL